MVTDAARWGIGVFPTSQHPADRVVDQFFDAVRPLAHATVRVHPQRGKLPVAFAPKRFGRARFPVLLPLMGPKFWILRAALATGHPVIPYCWDVWSPNAERWARELAAPGVVGVITTSTDARDLLRGLLPGRIEYVPEALAPHRYPAAVPPLADRSLHVLELGRRDESWHRVVSSALKANGFVHRFEASPGQIIFPTSLELDEALRQTLVSVCFTRRRTHPESAGTVDAITHRYLESMAFGCVLLGESPMDLIDLIGHDPGVQVDAHDPASQLLELLAEPAKLQPLVDANRHWVRNAGTWVSRTTAIASAVEAILQDETRGTG